MNTFSIIFGTMAVVMFLVMLTTMFGGNFVRFFHLIDKRGLLTEESWQKVNAMMAAGDFSLRASDGYDGVKRYNYISIGYTRDKNESVSKTFMGDDINKMVNEAFDWAQKEGYLETPHEK